MNTFQASFLGLVQGLTEFLPISSSGHLVLVKQLLNISTPGVLFEVVLHAGTLLAIVVYFWKEIITIKRKTVYLIAFGTIPAVVIGYVFSSQIEMIFESVKLVGIALIITGLVNLFVDRLSSKKKNVNYKESFVVGLAQAIAIIPGISRSGSTIFAGSVLGVNKKKIAQFSFLLSVPAVLGANVLEMMNYSDSFKLDIAPYVIGFVLAFISGFLAIKMVFRFLEKGRFKVFAYYCFIVGLLALVI